MFRSPPGAPRPHVPTPEEWIASFGRRFAMLAEPPAEWRLLVGTSSQDDFVRELQVQYIAANRRTHAMVLTAQPLPANARYPAETTLAGTMVNFADNASPRQGHFRWQDFEGETTPASLLVDGSEVEGSRFAFGGFFGTMVTVGEDEQIVVCGREEAEDTARSLVLGTTLRGEVWPRPLWAT
ncbi:hypothetical protein [Kitasatospora sp. McL0602]|uniref:hypothetical protein n=1 Tax=Kitasatospora sp. McL0602 TaxID=3439530 RepID=UPI003F8A91E3